MEGTHFVFWNWTVAVYLFVAGLSAGAFAVSVLAYFIGEEKYEDIARIGAYIAPFPLIFGLLFLIYDLERPYLFWKLLVTVQIHSVMPLGAWLLLIFSLISFLNFYLWLPERIDLIVFFRQWLQKWSNHEIVERIRVSRILESLTRLNLKRFRAVIGLIGMPVALFVGIYTGVLLGVLSPRPFWNNPMLPMLFLVSALKTGMAAISWPVGL
jgi:formate-dependent nitrite reductase membrane component NrfD